MRPVRTALQLLTFSIVITLAAPAPAGATARAPAIRIADGVTQPVFDYPTAIRERVFVESPVDSDHDGRRDRVEVRIIRPRETADQLRVPVIFQPSPYYAGLNDVPNHDDIDRDGATALQVPPSIDRAEESIVFAG